MRERTSPLARAAVTALALPGVTVREDDITGKGVQGDLN
jgi:hypothetical protein